MDAEKDPECLMLGFQCVENLGRLYPDSSGVLANFAADIFEILATYFPIHFTHVSLIFSLGFFTLGRFHLFLCFYFLTSQGEGILMSKEMICRGL